MSGRWRAWLALHLDENAAAWREIVGEVDAHALALLGRLEALARSLGELQRVALAPYGLNYAEFTTLGMLRTSPPDFRRSPTELRRLVGQSSAGMTRVLRKLERARLVRRRPQPEDARRIDVLLTPKGVALADEAFAALFAAPSERLAANGKRRREAWLHSLDELLAVLDPGDSNGGAGA
jgi:DNA-binding MarR family transcriptional regulator